jgi:hypothetical protein
MIVPFHELAYCLGRAARTLLTSIPARGHGFLHFSSPCDGQLTARTADLECTGASGTHCAPCREATKEQRAGPEGVFLLRAAPGPGGEHRQQELGVRRPPTSDLIDQFRPIPRRDRERTIRAAPD